MVNKFDITHESKGFENLREWWVDYDGSVITWRPVAPYLFAEDSFGQSIIDTGLKILEGQRIRDGYFQAAIPGMYLPATISNPHAALWTLNTAHSFDPDEGFYFFEGVDERPPSMERKATFSRNAPKLIAIYGPSHDKDGRQIIY